MKLTFLKPVIIFIGAQVNTQQYGGRPFGVGLLIAGIDVKLRE